MKMQHLLIVTVAVLQATLSAADWAVTVAITNALESSQAMEVHCKDRGTDFGAHQVMSGQTYNFGFNPMATADYFCGFTFDNTLHWFDIYIDKRDWNRCGASSTCSWTVKESGPCLAGDCYPWNANGVRRH